MPRAVRRGGNLPAEATSFVGRRRELAGVREKLAAARLVSLVGPGGVGKSRLALRGASHLARRYPGGVWMVELAELRDPALVANHVVAALGLRDQTATEPRDLLCSYLGDKDLLLVLDNCEHLLQATAELVAHVLAAAPGVRVVATSREPLALAGEHVLAVPPLPLPLPDTAEPLELARQNEAVMLFAERALEATGGFQLTSANQAAVVEICRRLDGLPLAIELAAVRMRALTPEQVRDRLDDRFSLLTGGSRAALPRHQTLRTTIEWSLDLLTPTERALLTRLSVFAGRFTLDDVEAVCSSADLPAHHTLDVVSSLLDKSLVTRDDTAGVACYRLHETMREYAALQLRRAGEVADLERRCAEHYLSRSRQLAVEGRYRLLEWLAWLELEIDNVRAVLRRCLDAGDTELGIDLATCLVWYWVTRATTEGVRWLDQLLAIDGVADHPWVGFVRGFLAVLQADPAAATPVLARGIAAARAANQPTALSQSLAMASIAAAMVEDRASSGRLLDEARMVADGLDDLGASLMLHQARVLNGFVQGDLGAARSSSAEGALLSRAAGDLYSLGMMLLNQGFAALMARDLRQSEQRFGEGLLVARRLDDRVAQCYLVGGLACCTASREPRRAARLFGAMETLRAEVGASINPGMAAALTSGRASAEAGLGQSKFARELESGRGLGREAAIRLALREADPPSRATTSQKGTGGGLARREHEVARLVGDGLTNKEIGRRLFISERTVESHVRNILNKLGLRSRSQVAAWVATQRVRPGAPGEDG